MALFMIMGCSVNKTVSVGNTVDIVNFKHPSNVVKFQWSFDTKPPTSRLDPRDFIPSNYHPNVTFIPDVPGKYIVRLAMITSEGSVVNKSFIYMAESQGNYLANVEQQPVKQVAPVPQPQAKPVQETKVETEPVKKLPPKIIEVPVVKEKVINKKTTVTKIPNEWKTAPIPGQNPNEIQQDPDFTTKTKIELVDDKGQSIDKSKTTTSTPAKVVKVSNTEYTGNEKFTLQVSSSPKEANAYELKDKLRKQGYDAFIETATINGVLYYRIRIGRFNTYEEAKNYRQQMINNTEFEPWIDKLQ
jgi:cell division septation protein DedD